MDTIKALFTATATVPRGPQRSHRTQRRHREGRPVYSERDGRPSWPGTAAPEHVLAAGHAACFGGALDFAGMIHRPHDVLSASLVWLPNP